MLDNLKVEVITSVSHLFYHQPDVFNVSELENVPNFLDTFDCLDGEVFSISFVELQGKVNISLYVVLSQMQSSHSVSSLYKLDEHHRVASASEVFKIFPRNAKIYFEAF